MSDNWIIDLQFNEVLFELTFTAYRHLAQTVHAEHKGMENLPPNIIIIEIIQIFGVV